MDTDIRNYYLRHKILLHRPRLLRRLYSLRPLELQESLRNYRRHRWAEACILSFPKSGRTWLRLMIGHAIKHHFSLEVENKNLIELDQFSSLHSDIPRILVTHDDDPQWKWASELSTRKNKYANKSVILLVRDPRDVIVSFYFQRTKRAKNYEGTIRDFLYHENTLKSLIEFYKIWSNNISVPKKFLLVTYEDLHRDPYKQLQDVLSFLGLGTVSETVLGQAVQFASFDNLRELEKNHYFASHTLSPGDKGDPESFKTRRGKIGGYQDYLTQSEIDHINSLLTELPETFYGNSKRLQEPI